MSSFDKEVIAVRVFRKRVSKTFKIENFSELEASEKITFDVALENNVYILSIGTHNVNPPFICFSIDHHKDNVKRNVNFKVIMKDIGARPFFQASDLITKNSPFTCSSKYTIRDIPMGCLIFHLELSCLSWTTEVTPQVKNTVSFSRMENLSRDFGQLYSERKNADVVIHVGKTEIPVHSQILSARSEVFAAMFEHDMTEKLNKIIQIHDINAMTMHYFLVFIYTGKLEGTADFRPDTLKQLYTAADKYAVMELKEMISDIMLSNMSLDNVASCAYLGFTHCDQRMQKAVIQFISRNMATLDSKQWRELEETAPIVAADVLNIIRTKDQAHQ